MTINEHKNLHFSNEEDTHMSSKNYETKWLQARFGFASHIALIACCVYYKKWCREGNFKY